MTINIQRVGGTARNDDRIRITREGGNLLVRHVDGDGKIVTTLTLTNMGLVGYITALAAMVRDDSDPFDCIQFNFPGFPSVLYKVARLHNPDVIRSIRTAAGITAESFFADMPDDASDSETESDASSTTISTGSEDEYADMPPLIPTRSQFPRRSPRFTGGEPCCPCI